MPAFIKDGVEFFEAMEGSQDAALSTKQQDYKCIWKVRWRDVERAKVALLGNTVARLDNESGTNYWNRTLPHAHPFADWLHCTIINKTEGKTPRGQQFIFNIAQYDWAFLYCIYSNLRCYVRADDDPFIRNAATSMPDETGLGRFVQEKAKHMVMHRATRIGSWLWVALYDPALPPTAPANARAVADVPLIMRFPRVHLTWTWLNVPLNNLNGSAILARIGSTNNSPILSPSGFVYPSGTLLLEGADWPDWNPIPGRIGFQVDVAFNAIYHPEGVNFWPNPNQGMRPMEVGYGTRRPFPLMDWKDMFRPVNVFP